MMRLVAVATGGAGLFWVLICIVPHERRRVSKSKTKKKWVKEFVVWVQEWETCG